MFILRNVYIFGMTGQVNDSFLYKGEVYVLSGYTKGEPFSPLDYGFLPKAATTACWRGFILYFTIEDEELFLVDMEINNEEELELNGIKPEIRDQGLRLYYQNVNLKLEYSGKLLIAKDFIQSMYVHMGFQRASSYETVLELEFKKGNLISVKDLSSKMKKRRKTQPNEGLEPKSKDEKGIKEWIKDTFSLKYKDE